MSKSFNYIFFSLLLFVMLFATKPQNVYAQTSGTCTWTLTNGVLTIEPTNGVSGVLNNSSYGWNNSAYCNRVNTVIVKPGVNDSRLRFA